MSMVCTFFLAQVRLPTQFQKAFLWLRWLFRLMANLLWHSLLGHPSAQIINSLMSQLGFSSIHVNNCDSCSIAKSHKLPFTLSEKRITAPFQLIHSDLWGPTVVPSFVGFRYAILELFSSLDGYFAGLKEWRVVL